jgi:hypothetical protein
MRIADDGSGPVSQPLGRVVVVDDDVGEVVEMPMVLWMSAAVVVDAALFAFPPEHAASTPTARTSDAADPALRRRVNARAPTGWSSCSRRATPR